MFVLDTYGRETWREMAQSAALPVMQFDAMLIYEDTLTEQALDATARFLDKPRTDVLEDIGTYLASHPNVETLRRLLRFGGAHFIEFCILWMTCMIAPGLPSMIWNCPD